MMHGEHGFGFIGGFMWLFWILLIVLVLWLVKAAMASNERPRSKDKGALEILEARYARGEIDREEFERMRKDLQARQRP